MKPNRFLTPGRHISPNSKVRDTLDRMVQLLESRAGILQQDLQEEVGLSKPTLIKYLKRLKAKYPQRYSSYAIDAKVAKTRKIIGILSANQSISDKALAKLLDKTPAAVAGKLARMRKMGVIKSRTNRYLLPNGKWCNRRLIAITKEIL